MVLIYH